MDKDSSLSNWILKTLNNKRKNLRFYEDTKEFEKLMAKTYIKMVNGTRVFNLGKKIQLNI